MHPDRMETEELRGSHPCGLRGTRSLEIAQEKPLPWPLLPPGPPLPPPELKSPFTPTTRLLSDPGEQTDPFLPELSFSHPQGAEPCDL